MCVSCRCDGCSGAAVCPSSAAGEHQGLAARRVCAAGQVYGLGHGGGAGEHQIFCGGAGRLPELCMVGWVCLGVMCPLCVSTKVLD